MNFVDTIIPAWGTFVEPGAADQIRRCFAIHGRAALMADHHKGYGVPIGGVIAHEYLVSPSGVGFDIGCGNKAVRTDADASDVRKNIKTIMDDVWSNISFGLARANKEQVDHKLFDDDPAWSIEHGVNTQKWKLAELKDTARRQLGTVGSGNHYVDIFIDEQEHVWIGVHFGSRGFGHKIATHFLNRLGTKDDMDSAPAVLDSRTQEGQDYIAAMQLAGRYAYAGRDWVCDRVAKILGAKIQEEVHNHHNFAWHEQHGDEKLWVVRKGATPAFPGQRSFIGGTMCDNAVIIEGIDHAESKLALYSTVHGAGRVMGRNEAKGKKNADGTWSRTPKVTPEMMAARIQETQIELRGADLDEAPQCYKPINDVLACHSNMIKIVHTLKPIGVAMAGKDTRDPYKD